MNKPHHPITTVTPILIALLTFAAFTLVSPAQAGDVVRVGGAGSGLGIMKILAEAFEKTHPGIKIQIMQNLGSSGGIKALSHRAIDIAISGRPLKPEEQKEPIAAVECARSPFILVVHQGVSKTDLTTRELQSIYQGQLSKWPDGTRIRQIIRPVTDTDTVIVENISKEMEVAVHAANSRPGMILAVTDQESLESVSKTPGALGTATLVQVETEKLPVKVLSFNGIKPTVDAIATGRYHLSKPLYLMSAPHSPPAALQFIQFVRSAKGRAILAKNGSLPVTGESKTK